MNRAWIRNSIMLVVVGLITLAFVITIGAPTVTPTAGAVAEVDGEAIPLEEFLLVRQNFRDVEVPGMKRSDLEALIDNQTLEILIRREITTLEAKRLGLRVPDAALRDYIQSNPQYRENGLFNRELVEIHAANRDISVRRLMDLHRQDLLLQRFSRLATGPLRASEAEARQAILDARTQLRLRYAVARASEFADRVEVTPEQIASLREAEPDRLQAEYERRRSEFQQPERVRASHILFRGDDALDRALATRVRLDAGEDFAELARELSEDEATRGAGGSLGVFARGRMVAAFEDAAFSLEPGVVSSPVESEFGVHLVRVDERLAAVSREFQDVAERLAEDLLRQDGALDAARRAAEDLVSRLEAGEEFISAAGAAGLEFSVTAPFSPADPAIPELRGLPEATDIAAVLTPDHPHAPRPLGGEDALYVLSLLERTEPDPEEVAAELEATRERLTEETRNLAEGLWYQARRDALEQDGAIRVYPIRQ